MRTDIHNFCKVGIVHGQAYPNANDSPELFLSTLEDILVDEYFDLVEISKLPYPELNAVVPDLIRCAHMDFTYCAHSRIFAGKLNPNSLDESLRRATVKEVLSAIDEASAFGCKEIQFLSRTYDPDKVDEAVEALAKSTREISAYAAEKDMIVTLEIFDYDIDKKSLLGPIDRVVKLIDMVKDDCPNFGFMVDCSHIPMIREPLDVNLDPIQKHILHAHMGNTQIRNPKDVAYGDMHPRFGYPESENDVEYLAAFLQKLVDYGYLYEGGGNALSFEVRPTPVENPRIVVANSKRALNAAWRLVKG